MSSHVVLHAEFLLGLPVRPPPRYSHANYSSWFLLDCRNGMVHASRVSRRNCYWYWFVCMSLKCAIRHLIVRSICFVVDGRTETHAHASYRGCKIKSNYNSTRHLMLCCIPNSMRPPSHAVPIGIVRASILTFSTYSLAHANYSSWFILQRRNGTVHAFHVSRHGLHF